MNQQKINKQILERLEKIELLIFKSKKKNNTKHKDFTDLTKINFDLNTRAFFKRYGKNLTGPKNFTLIVAFLCEGQVGKSILAEDIINCWNKNFVFLGGKKLTSGTFGTRAKEKEWIDSKKYRFYELTSKWQEIFS